MIHITDVMDLNSDVQYTVSAIAMLYADMNSIPVIYSTPEEIEKVNTLHHAISLLLEKAAEEVACVEKALEDFAKTISEVSA